MKSCKSAAESTSHVSTTLGHPVETQSYNRFSPALSAEATAHPAVNHTQSTSSTRTQVAPMPLPWHGTKEFPDLSKQPKSCSWAGAPQSSVWCRCFHGRVICGPRHGTLCPGWLGRVPPRRKNWLCSSPAVWTDILLRLWLGYLMLKNPSASTTVMRIPVPTIRDGTCPLDAIQCCLVPLLLQSAAPTPHFLAFPLAAARSLKRLSIQHREGSWGEGVQMTSVSHT